PRGLPLPPNPQTSHSRAHPANATEATDTQPERVHAPPVRSCQKAYSGQAVPTWVRSAATDGITSWSLSRRCQTRRVGDITHLPSHRRDAQGNAFPAHHQKLPRWKMRTKFA